MPESDQRNEGNEPKPGSRLARALGEMRNTAVFISPDVDKAVLEQAKPHLARIRARRLSRQRTAWLALAACAVLLALVAATWLNRSGRQFAREDLNHDGRVDILDAFQLAREIRDGKARVDTGDFNGDGKVDEADVELLAKRAVNLEKGGHS